MIATIIISVIVVFLLVGAGYALWRGRRNGGCSSCSGCSNAGCPQFPKNKK